MLVVADSGRVLVEQWLQMTNLCVFCGIDIDLAALGFRLSVRQSDSLQCQAYVTSIS